MNSPLSNRERANLSKAVALTLGQAVPQSGPEAETSPVRAENVRVEKLQELAVELGVLYHELEAQPPTACTRCVGDALAALRRAIRHSCLGPE